MNNQVFIEYDRLLVIDTLKNYLFYYKREFEKEKTLYDKEVEAYKSLSFLKKIFKRNPEIPRNMFSPSALWERAGTFMRWIPFLENHISLFEKSESKTILVAGNSDVADFLLLDCASTSL